MRARDGAVWLVLGLGVSCALPALRVDADLDEEGSAGDENGGTAGTGTGGSKGGRGGSDSGSGGKGGVVGTTGGTGGKGGAVGTTGGKGGALTGGTGGADPLCAGVSCEPGQVCVAGDCVCPTGYELCSDGCKNTHGDHLNCGQCGAACGLGQGCTDSTCVGMVCPPLAGSAQRPEIDDSEDGNSAIEPVDGRSGYWYTYSAENTGCSVVPLPFATEPGGPTGSTHAIRVRGMGCDWHGLGLDLHFAGRVCPFDASAFTGLSFVYKSISRLRVAIPTSAVWAIEYGGSCNPAVSSECDNAHGAYVPAATDWTEVTIPFSSFVQTSGGTHPTIDKNEIMGIQFNPDGTAPSDFWIDELVFTTN